MTKIIKIITTMTHADNGGRIDERRFTFFLRPLPSQYSWPIGSDVVQDTSFLPGHDQVCVQFVEDFGMFLEGPSKRRPSFYIFPDLANDILEDFAILLDGKDLQGLNKGQARIDHRGQLPSKDGNGTVAHLLSKGK
jgi:hypothetical protein